MELQGGFIFSLQTDGQAHIQYNETHIFDPEYALLEMKKMYFDTNAPLETYHEDIEFYRCTEESNEFSNLTHGMRDQVINTDLLATYCVKDFENITLYGGLGTQTVSWL